jgi:hypothetical protein
VNVPVNIGEALADQELLGAALGSPDSWGAWFTVLKAAFGTPLNRAERRAFVSVAGSRKPPSERVRELWCIIGRRGGKSRIAAALAVFIAAFVDHRAKLSPGEVGYVLILAASKAQAGAVLGYVLGFLESSPVLRGMVDSVTSDEIRLAGGIVIAAHPNNFRTVRGRTLLAAIFDEVAYWRDESSAAPDVETYRAILPALATTGGMLVGISSPYRQIGLLHTRHRDHWGKDNPAVLVVRGPTELFNSTIDRAVIRQAREDDPVAASAEWDAQFRADIAQFLDDASIDAAIDCDRPLELPPRLGVKYHAFTDASAGRHDAFTMCVGHKEDDRFIADVIRGRKPPFDPKSVAADYARLAKDYRCSGVTGDSFAGDWVTAAFRDAGASYRRADLPRSGLYLEALPLFMRGAVSIPDMPILIRELRLLERRTARSGKDSVDHGTGGSDDHANALAGAMRLAMKPVIEIDPGIAGPMIFTYGTDADFSSLGEPNYV